jgi:hypothetical protein
MSLPLDPRKSPWKRGDVCTLGFKQNGFVVNVTSEDLEVLWMPEATIERVPAERLDLLRVAHASSLSDKGTATNLEILEDIEALHRTEHVIRQRISNCKTDREKQEVGVLIERSLAKDGCAWDKANSSRLFLLAVTPESVGFLFKLRERVHRRLCKRH